MDRALARLLGIELHLMPVKVAVDAAQAITDERAGVGFFAIDPGRGHSITFAAPYLLIEGTLSGT